MICDGGDNRMGKRFAHLTVKISACAEAHPTVKQVVIVSRTPAMSGTENVCCTEIAWRPAMAAVFYGL